LHGIHASLYFIRTSGGEEVDLIIDREQYKEFIEIKKSETFKPSMLKVIEKFIQPGDFDKVIYNGSTMPMVDPLAVLNYQDYLN